MKVRRHDKANVSSTLALSSRVLFANLPSCGAVTHRQRPSSLARLKRRSRFPSGMTKREMTSKKDGFYSVGLKSLKGWVKKSSTFLLTSSACSMTVGWPELGTIQRLAWGMFW